MAQQNSPLPQLGPDGPEAASQSFSQTPVVEPVALGMQNNPEAHSWLTAPPLPRTVEHEASATWPPFCRHVPPTTSGRQMPSPEPIESQVP
jgi:hypothetical protein